MTEAENYLHPVTSVEYRVWPANKLKEIVASHAHSWRISLAQPQSMVPVLLIPPCAAWGALKHLDVTVRVFRHRREPLNPNMISLAAAFISNLWLLLSGKIICTKCHWWIDSACFATKNSFFTETSDETNSFSTFQMIKCNLHTNNLCCCLIWLVLSGPFR